MKVNGCECVLKCADVNFAVENFESRSYSSVNLLLLDFVVIYDISVFQREPKLVFALQQQSKQNGTSLSGSKISLSVFNVVHCNC